MGVLSVPMPQKRLPTPQWQNITAALDERETAKLEMRCDAEQMAPYMWRRPSLLCAFMLGESESMDDWYLTRQLADYLRQTLRDGVCAEMETNR